MAFKTAAAQGFRDAIAAASPVILEPISRLTVTVPSALQGDVLGDISARRGRVVASDALDGDQIIAADVPAAELRTYAVDFRALAGGRGSFEVRHDHYDVLPSHLVDAVTKASASV
jgi:elongation factor G